MATVASLKAAKTVKDEALAKRLAEMAYFMIDRTLPYTAIPDDVVDTLARCLLPKIQAYFNSPEGRAEFEEWKRQQAND